MQRSVSVTLVGLLVLGALFGPVQAGERKRKKGRRPPPAERIERKIEESYLGPAAVTNAPVAGFIAVCAGGASNGCFENYELASDVDRFASVQVRDQQGFAVHGYLVACNTPACESETRIVADFCTETEEPVDLNGARGMSLYITAQPCPDGTPSVVTQGQITITLANLP